jgi:hypothetical protein
MLRFRPSLTFQDFVYSARINAKSGGDAVLRFPEGATFVNLYGIFKG